MAATTGATMDALTRLTASATPFFEWLLRASWQAALLAVLVVIVQWSLRGRLSARWRYALWTLVLIRLLLPALPASRASLYNLAALFRPDSPTQHPPRIRAETFKTTSIPAKPAIRVVPEPITP